MASISVVLRKKQNQDGTYPLCLRLTKDRKSSYVTLGQDIKESDWDVKLRKVKRTHKNSGRLNNFIVAKLAEANSALLELEMQEMDFSVSMLRDRLVRTKNTNTFFAQADLHFDIMKREGNYNRHAAEKGAVNHFKRFLKGKDIAFTDITLHLLENFKAYLKGEIKVSERTAVNYLIIIRTIYNRAIKAGIVDRIHYPFGPGKIILRRPESEKIGLEVEEVRKIENAELNKDSFIHEARNRWLISFYFAGARASDVLMLRWSDFNNGRLHYTMNKNLKTGSLKVSEKAQKILAEYKPLQLNEDDLVFPDLETVQDFKNKDELQRAIKYRVKKIDSYLKKLAKLLEIEKPLTMHIARHTFGNLSGDKIPIQKLQQLYRHSNITTTVNYQKAFLYKGTDDALDSVLDY